MVVGSRRDEECCEGEARRLIKEHGDEAYGKAAAAARLAMRSRNSRMSAFLSGVVIEVARQTKLHQLAPRTFRRAGTTYLRIASPLEGGRPKEK
jgi:hypothetical protein